MVINRFTDRLAGFGRLWALFRVGSRAYGLNTPDSDWDYRGIFLPNEEYILGLKKVEQVKVMDDCWVCHDVRQFVKIVIAQTPTILEMLFIDNPLFQYPESWANFRKELRKLITVDVFTPYSAYLLSQIRKAETRVPIGKRAELIKEVGYDSKFMSHAARLAIQGAGLLRTGNLEVRVPEEKRRDIMRIKLGEASFDEALTYCKDMDRELHAAYKVSPLPKKQPLNEFERDVFIPFMRILTQ